MSNEIEIRVIVRDEASAQVAAIAEKVRAAAQGSASSTASGDVQRFGRQPGEASASGDAVRVPVEPDDAGLKEKVKADVEAAGAGEKVDVPVKVDTGDSLGKLAAFDAAVHAADDSGNGLTQDSAGRWRNALGQFATDAEKAAAGVENAGNAIDGAGKKADGAGKGANSGGNNFSFLYSKVTLLSEAALALGPALAAIPAVMGAVAVGGATVALGLGGVIKALQDYGAQSTATGQSSAQLAATAFSNSVAIRNAEQAITDAKRQAAIQQQNSADSVAAAQEHLAQAQQSEQVATESLNQAWKDAINVLADLNNSAADAANGVADAQIALKQAQLSTAAVVASSLSTDDMKKAALQAVIDAQQHLTDAQQHAVEAQGAANDANAKGVSGSTAVVSASRAQAQAAQGVVDAQHALVVAQRNAAQQQEASAEAIQKAVQNLSDTYEQQKLAAAAAAASGSSAANKFQQDMAKLTPAGQAFVNQLISMKTGAKELAATAQTSMLPGLTIMLKDASPLMPTFNTAIQTMGMKIGDLAISFGKLMDSPAFKGQLTTVLKDGANFAGQFGSGLVNMFAGITKAAAAAGPIVAGLGIGFQTLMGSGIPALFQGLAVNAAGAGQTMQGVLGIVSNLLGPIGTLAGMVSGALGPAFQVLASPAVAQALQSIAVSVGTLFQSLAPLVTLLANGLVVVLKILVPMLSRLATVFQENHRWLTPLVGLLIAYWTATKLAAVATAVLGGALDLLMFSPVVVALVAVTLALVYCWEHFAGFRDFVHGMLGDFHNWFFDFWHFLDGVWHAIPDAAKAAWDKISNAVSTAVVGAYNTVSSWFGKIGTFFAGVGATLARAGSGMWDWVRDTFKDAINIVIGWWDDLHFTTPSVHIPGTNIDVGGVGIGMPTIPKLHAFGGIAGGLSAIIGDAGIEATKLPNGSIVMPHANTASMLAGGGRGGDVNVNITWDGTGVPDELWRMLRQHIRIKAGSGPNSVQKALGQSV